MNYENKNDLIKIAKEMSKVTSPIVKAKIAAECILQKIMNTNLPFISRMIINTVYKLKGYDAAVNLIATSIIPSSPESYENIIHYLVHGKDISNDKSAGGFNQEELYILQSILSHYKVYI